MSKYKESQLSSVVSQPYPQHGQKHRSSGNFSTDNADSNANFFIIRVTKNPNPDKISFDVMEDKSGGTDPIIWRGMYSGNRVAVERIRNLYIANPVNAKEDFTVEFYEVSD